MKDLTITDVRVLPGDSAFLIDDGKTSILWDTGFGFTGYQLADNVKKILGNRPLDYIFLTHSHYDHVLGTPYVMKYYPDAKVVAGEYAKEIFERPSAKAIMRDLDQKYAKTCGIFEYEDLIDELKVDISVKDQDTLICGDMKFTVINLPGHTKCSIGFYMEENKLFLGSETLGVYFGKGTYLPFYLVSYQSTMDSFEKVEKLDIENILLPHYGLLNREESKQSLQKAKKVAIEVADKMKNIFLSGKTKEDAMSYFKETFYLEHVKPTYPIDAFHLNTSIIIDLIKKEFVS